MTKKSLFNDDDGDDDEGEEVKDKEEPTSDFSPLAITVQPASINAR